MISTEGIVLRATQYTSSAYILKVYTRHDGVVSVMLRTSKKNNRQALKEQLSIVEISYAPGRAEVIHPKEIQLSIPYKSISHDFDKRAIAIFLGEILSKSIVDASDDEDLYDFIRAALITLDDSEVYLDFHVWFLWKFARFLGIGPYLNPDKHPFFDFQEAVSLPYAPIHPNYIEGDLYRALCEVNQAKFHHDIKLSNDLRKQLLNLSCDYYLTHLHGLREIKSLEVIQSLYL